LVSKVIGAQGCAPIASLYVNVYEENALKAMAGTNKMTIFAKDYTYLIII